MYRRSTNSHELLKFLFSCENHLSPEARYRRLCLWRTEWTPPHQIVASLSIVRIVG